MYDWLLKNGVIFNTKKLKCLEEVDGYDLVINSSGCGAKYLGVFIDVLWRPKTLGIHFVARLFQKITKNFWRF